MQADKEIRKRKLGQFTEEYLREKVAKEYEGGIATFKINPKKTALIVVDMTDEFTKPEYAPSWVPEATRQLPKIKSLIEESRKLGVPVIYTCYACQPSFVDMNPYFRNFWTPADNFEDYDGPVLFTKETIDKIIAPDRSKDIIIAKPSYGAFTNTALDYILKNLGVDTVVICGTNSNYCCGTTAREAHAHGYKVVFGSDINSADLPELQEFELKILRRGFALVLSKDEIIEALNGDGPFTEK